MRCAWQAYINLLPHWMRQEVDKQGREELQELRIRIGLVPELIFQNRIHTLSRQAIKEDIAFIINAASEYSPWSASTVAQGYLTAAGGHRVGICGVCTVADGQTCGINYPTSVCVRVARDYLGIAAAAKDLAGSILIIGPPGSGKTTLLRDLIRNKSDAGRGCVAVVDEREEIFPLFNGQACFPTGIHTDVMSGCSKEAGITAVLRSMNPVWIAVDEITAAEDSAALLHAGWCGVSLLATAHAGSMEDLKTRPIYRELFRNRLFKNIIVLSRDKSWHLERMEQWY